MSIHKPNAVFYCGANGAGKSTLRQFNQDKVSLVIDSDHIAAELNPDSPKSANIEAGRKALWLYRQAIVDRTSFSMESTLSGLSALQRIHRARRHGYHVTLNYVGLSHPELNIMRIRERVRMGGHWIDPDLVRKRFYASRDNLSEAVMVADETYIYDNSGLEPILQMAVQNGAVYALNPLVSWVEAICTGLQQHHFKIVGELS